MTNDLNYRLSKEKKSLIAQNLIDILEKDANISEDTRKFIFKWILTGPEGKKKAFFDVWDIVLKNYLPPNRPILFRAFDRIGKRKKIASFTASFRCIKKFSRGSGCLLICDTNEALEFEEDFFKPGEYKHTFYPLVKVLEIGKRKEWSGFMGNSINDYIGEDEYIMRINWDNMESFKWV